MTGSSMSNPTPNTGPCSWQTRRLEGTWAAVPPRPPALVEAHQPLKLEVWPAHRAASSAVLHCEDVTPPPGNFGLVVHALALPTTNAHRVVIPVERARLETNFPGTHD